MAYESCSIGCASGPRAQWHHEQTRRKVARGVGDKTTAGSIVVSFLDLVRAGQSGPAKTRVVSGINNDYRRMKDTLARRVNADVGRNVGVTLCDRGNSAKVCLKRHACGSA